MRFRDQIPSRATPRSARSMDFSTSVPICCNRSLMRYLISERLQQIGTLVLKSIDRADRGVALEGIWSLKRILDHYGTYKKQMPDRWFHVARKDFIGLSAEALEIVN